MNYEVVVVGGGIGGLTVAALLAARGVNVCLLERQSHVGGCVANFDHLGFQFEPTHGLYSGWEAGGIHDQVFSELPIQPPRVNRLSPAYTVRLPDNTDVAVSDDPEEFEMNLRVAFPECVTAAIDFYRALTHEASSESAIDPGNAHFAPHLKHCSLRFRRFVDIQLQTFAQCSSDECAYDLAALALNPQRGRWEIYGGAQALADSLAESLKKSGGTLRINAPVLRLAYSSDGTPVGVDLLTGEQVIATRAIISNLTVWDTYGKLVGLSRTPKAIASEIRSLHSWAAYLLFLGMDRAAASRLPSRHILALTDWQEGQTYDPASSQFAFAAASNSDPRAPESKVAVTISTFTNAEDWFGFHEDHTAHEKQDQLTLEAIWSRLHAAIPELGDMVEVIESATPQTLYETTRRKFGMIGRPANSTSQSKDSAFITQFPNLFLVSDTVAPMPSLAGVSELAYKLASAIAPR